MEHAKRPRKAGAPKYIPLAVAALLVLAAGIALWYFPKEYAYRLQLPRDQNLNPVNGAWELAGFDLENEIVFLEGSVEYVTGVLLSPEEFAAYQGEIRYGAVPSDAQVVTARLRLLFPEDRPYALASKSVDYNERVYINGEWHHDVGRPGLTAGESRAGQNFNWFEVLPVNGAVEIIRQSSNFVHKENSGFAGIYVGSYANIKQMVAVSQLFTAINIGLYLCLFFLHMVFFLFIRSYRANLWFSLLCLTWALRTGFIGQFVYWAMFPHMSWTPIYKLGSISLALAGVLLLLMLRDEFPGVVQKWPLRIALGALGAFAVFCAFAGTVLISRVKVVAEGLMLAVALYLAVRFCMVLPKQIRRKKLLLEQGITLAGLAVVVFTMLHDAVRYNNLLPGIFYYEIGDVGTLVLVLLQMAAMALGTMRQLTNARQNAKIAWENAEIARKNERLMQLRAENAEKDMELHKQLVASIPPENLVAFGPLVLNTEKSQAFLQDNDLQLSPKEFLLLLYLIRHQGGATAREALYEAVWQQPYVSSDRAFDSNMYRLRKKMEGSGYCVVNVRGRGYWLEEE